MYVWGIDLASSYDFAIGFWNCSDTIFIFMNNLQL
jgi:hypothetical protein